MAMNQAGFHDRERQGLHTWEDHTGVEAQKPGRQMGQPHPAAWHCSESLPLGWPASLLQPGETHDKNKYVGRIDLTVPPFSKETLAPLTPNRHLELQPQG